MGSRVEKEKTLASELARRGSVCVLCGARAADAAIQWHHLIMLFDERGKPVLDEEGNVKFDKVADISTMIGQRSFSVDHVKTELAKCIPLCVSCHLNRVHGHDPTADQS